MRDSHSRAFSTSIWRHDVLWVQGTRFARWSARASRPWDDTIMAAIVSGWKPKRTSRKTTASGCLQQQEQPNNAEVEISVVTELSCLQTGSVQWREYIAQDTVSRSQPHCRLHALEDVAGDIAVTGNRRTTYSIAITVFSSQTENFSACFREKLRFISSSQQPNTLRSHRC